MNLRTVVAAVGWLLLLALPILLASPAQAYYGSLTNLYGGGLLATGNWATDLVTLEWWVTQNSDGSWHYQYLFAHPEGETSHFIVEVSETFTMGNMIHWGGDFEEIEIGWHDPEPANPGMPEAIWGMKLDEAAGVSTTIWFDAWRMPVWGDFYAVDGRGGGQEGGGDMGAAWNLGFTSPDWDPAAPPDNGSSWYHVLVPDSLTPIPEPGTILLLGLGLAGAGLWRFGRKRRAGQ